MKQIITLILILGLIGLVSAIYPGESEYIDLSTKMDSYTNYWIQGNTSAINITMNNLLGEIQIPVDYLPGEFTIIFNGTLKSKIVEVPVYRGGGGTKTIYVDKNVTEYVLKNDTIYLTGDCSENICDLNQSNNQTDDIIPGEPEHLNWLQRFWRWFKGIFS